MEKKMLISKKLQDAINAQISHEFGATMLYLHIAAYFDQESLLKLSELFFAQAEEEKMHGMKFVHFLLEAGAELAIPEIPIAVQKFESAEIAVGTALKWEKIVTKQVNELMDIAIADNDHISQDFLRWFVTEQLEELSKMGTFLGIIKQSNGNLLLAEQVIERNQSQAASASAE
jgi:ferritin